MAPLKPIRIGLLIGAFGVAGCASPLRPAASATQVADQAMAPSPSEGKNGDVFAALSLTPEQRKAVEALRERVGAQLLDVDDARHILVDTVADTIEEGKIDDPKVAPAARLFVTATERAKPALLDDLNELHRILTPEQRAELAARIGGKKAGNDPKPKGSKDRTKRVLDALDLSFTQSLAIVAALATLSEQSDDFSELKDELDAATEAFATDSFDARNLAIGKAPVAQIVVDEGFAALQLVLPELNEYQHHVLAEMARRMLDPSRRPHGADPSD